MRVRMGWLRNAEEGRDAMLTAGRRYQGRGWCWRYSRIALAMAVAIGLPWILDFDGPRDGPSMSRITGYSGTLIKSLTFSPDGRTMALVDGCGRVGLISLFADGPLLRELTIPRSARVAEFSPDGRYLAVGGNEPSVVLFDLHRCMKARTLSIPIEQTTCLSFSRDGRILAVASVLSPGILIWDIEADRQQIVLTDPPYNVWAVSFASDGRTITTVLFKFGFCGSKRKIMIWNLATGQPRPMPFERWIVASAFSPDGRMLAISCGEQRGISVFGLEADEPPRSIESEDLIRWLSISPDGRLLATADGGRFVIVRRLADGRALLRLDGETDIVSHPTFSPDGRFLAAAGNDGDIRLWRLDGAFAADAQL